MFDVLKKTYQGKKVFLTGHTGFKGSWLLKTLSMLGANITGYALAPEGDLSLYNILNGDKLCTSIIADLRDRRSLHDAIEGCQPDFIFHLAAQPLVRLSYQIPSETFEINAIGTSNVLSGLARINKPSYGIFITTDKVYHNYEWPYPYRENDRLGGYDPYSASKACTELVIDSYRNSFFHPAQYNKHQKAIAVGRAGNVIGGGDWAADRLIPDIARSLSKEEPVEIRNPDAVRPWQHVLESLSGYLLLGAKLYTEPGKYAQAYNFGPYVNDALPVRQMVEMAIACWGKGDYFINSPVERPHEAGLLKLDISKATSELDWKPKLNASEAVKVSIDWYKSFYENAVDITSYTEEQIRTFFNG